MLFVSSTTVCRHCLPFCTASSHALQICSFLQAADAIKAMLSPTATVVRNGQRDTIDADLLVPGDVVVIKSGDKVPADLRLLECSNLQVRRVRMLLCNQLLTLYSGWVGAWHVVAGLAARWLCSNLQVRQGVVHCI
jgi:hypothetical protein